MKKKHDFSPADEDVVKKTHEFFVIWETRLESYQMFREKGIGVKQTQNILSPEGKSLNFGVTHHCYNNYISNVLWNVRCHLAQHSVPIFSALDEYLKDACSYEVFDFYRKYAWLPTIQTVCFDNLVFFPNQILIDDISKEQFDHNMKIYGMGYSKKALCAQKMPLIIEILCSTWANWPEEIQSILVNQFLALFDRESAPFLKKPKVISPPNIRTIIEISCCTRDLPAIILYNAPQKVEQ